MFNSLTGIITGKFPKQLFLDTPDRSADAHIFADIDDGRRYTVHCNPGAENADAEAHGDRKADADAFADPDPAVLFDQMQELFVQLRFRFRNVGFDPEGCVRHGVRDLGILVGRMVLRVAVERVQGQLLKPAVGRRPRIGQILLCLYVYDVGGHRYRVHDPVIVHKRSPESGFSFQIVIFYGNLTMKLLQFSEI